MRVKHKAHQLYFHLPYLLIKQNLTKFKLTNLKKKILINQENNKISLSLKQKNLKI